MDIKIIKFNRLRFADKGSYGEYYRIEGTNDGIKVMKPGNDIHTSISDVKNSYDFKQVKIEFNRLKKMNNLTRCVPKAKYLAIVEEKCTETHMPLYRCAYVMSHIKGKLTYDLSENDNIKLNAARKRLTKKGIHQTDHHDGNVIVRKVGKNKRFIFIDAGGLRFRSSGPCGWS